MADQALPSGLVIERNVSLAPFTSWIVGGAAEIFFQPKTIQDLREAVAWSHLSGRKITILGGGTNVLVSDAGVRDVTIGLRKLSGLDVQPVVGSDGAPRVNLICLAGTSKSELLKNFLKLRLEPALFLAGLPGDVGGGIVMNAGVGEMMKPREFNEITDWVEVLRLPEDSVLRGEPSSAAVSELANRLVIDKIQSTQLRWDYRHSEGWQPGIVVRAGLSWPSTPVDDILTRVKEANRTRLSKQPLDQPSCGSVFRNPPGTSAGRVIESCGLKGYTVGGAKVSEKHANFIVNFNEASALDIHNVITHVKESVLAQAGVELRTEVVYLGF